MHEAWPVTFGVLVLLCGIMFFIADIADPDKPVATTQPSTEEVAKMEKDLAALQPGDLVVWKETYEVLVTQKNLKDGGRMMFYSPHAGERVEWSAETMSRHVLRVVKKDDSSGYSHWSQKLAHQIAGIVTTQPDL